jgi:hypothetical protein
LHSLALHSLTTQSCSQVFQQPVLAPHALHVFRVRINARGMCLPPILALYILAVGVQRKQHVPISV